MSHREAFGLPAGLSYLNCAYMAPLHRSVEEAGIRGIRRKRRPWELGSTDFFRESDALRAAFCALVGGEDPARVAILPSVSYGVSAAARNTEIRRGMNVVLTHQQFPGNVYPWRRVAAEAGASVRMVAPPPGEVGGGGWTERILEAIDGATAVVALAHVHWTDGTLFDLAEVGRRAREVGAALVVDGTQSVGALPFSLEEVRPDALVVAGYKWLLGPYSLALGYFGPRYDQGVPLEEGWIVREGSEDFPSLVDYRDSYGPGAVRYDVGERSNFILVPMLLEALHLLEGWGVEVIQAHTRELTDAVARGAAELGFRSRDRAWRSGHILGLRTPTEVEPGRLHRALHDRGVMVSLRGTALRISPHLYNQPSDVDALLEGLEAAVRGS